MTQSFSKSPTRQLSAHLELKLLHLTSTTVKSRLKPFLVLVKMETEIIQDVVETGEPSGQFLQASLEDQEYKYQVILMDSSSGSELEEEEQEDGPLKNCIINLRDDKPSSRPLVYLPAISSKTEEEMMKASKREQSKQKKTKQETLARKFMERFKECDDENFYVNEVADEEDEDPKRINDLLNIFEGLGLLKGKKKKGKKTKHKKIYEKENHENMMETLKNLKQTAIDVDLKSQISKALEKTSVLQFSQEETKEEGGETKEFHLKLLTEKILMIFLSFEHGNPSYSFKQIRNLVFNEDMKTTKNSVQIKITRVLKTLVGLEILSVVERVTEGPGRRLEALYQLQLNIGSSEAVEEADPNQHHDLLQVAMSLYGGDF